MIRKIVADLRRMNPMEILAIAYVLLGLAQLRTLLDERQEQLEELTEALKVRRAELEQIESSIAAAVAAAPAAGYPGRDDVDPLHRALPDPPADPSTSTSTTGASVVHADLP